MKKRRILIASLCVCIAAVMAFGTLAYFTAQDSVSNKFYTAAYDPTNPDTPINPSDLFSISVYETDITDATGATTTTEGNTYEDILPGSKVDKDPTVENTGKYSAYIRMNVTVSKADEWQAIVPAGTDLTTIFGGFDDTKWTLAGTPVEDDANNTLTYSYYLNTALAPNETATLFETVTIPTYITAEQFATIAEFTISVSAEAIQSENTGTVEEAFALYDAQENSN